jgi:two-component system chemotaxis response regulator CheB
VIRVLVVDDSPTVRALIAAVLGSDPDITVVGEAVDGEQAVAMAEKLTPDLITMDLHMPVMDGLAATRAIMMSHPTPIVVMTGSANAADVALGFEVLRAGALAITDKPSAGTDTLEVQWARMIETVKALADVHVVRHRPRSSTPASPSAAQPIPRRVRASAIGVGASAGGPTAVRDFLASIPAAVATPVLVVQHIAAEFAAGFAAWLDTELGAARRVVVATQGARPLERTVYVAPAGRHLGLAPGGGAIQLSDAPPMGGFRPSVTYLFESLARELGAAAIGVILSGMGSDGVAGLRALRDAGGLVIAQDRESSLVYGMPGAVTLAGIAETSLEPSAIGPYIAAAMGRAPG